MLTRHNLGEVVRHSDDREYLGELTKETGRRSPGGWRVRGMLHFIVAWIIHDWLILY